MKEPVFVVPDMLPEEVMEMSRNMYRLFFSPRFILHKISGGNIFTDWSYLLKGLAAVKGHLKDFSKIH